ncbi:Mannose-6-phosphate isomerase [Candidatus Magnetomorum sp. HK-1]|nr:Mannose-6-phosphate isomerase [Candidatus Magnetomorum sp. HK-1]
MEIYEMKNTIKNYAWGSKSFLPKLMGITVPDNKPQAELWMGTHKQGISQVKRVDKNHSEWESLANLIMKQTEKMLGPYVADCFKGQLPFLFKILAIDHPLSIQVHPNAQQAIQGFELENQQSIPLKAANRNFKDKFDKPELIVALTPLWAMCGFRPFNSIQKNFQLIADDSLFKAKHPEHSHNTTSTFFYNLMHLSEREIKILFSSAANYAAKHKEQIHWQWVSRLSELFNNDVGALAPLFLNTVCLKPHEALFIQPGILHAYLEGNAIEIMCNSDNVIRGGLTVKHIDLEKLLEIVQFSSEGLHFIAPKEIQNNEWLYQTPAKSFLLARYDIKNPFEVHVHGPEILLCVKGKICIHQKNTELCLKPGMSAFVAHSAERYTIDGNGEVFKAFIRKNTLL